MLPINASYTATETVIGTMTVAVGNKTYDVVVTGRLRNRTAGEIWGENITVSPADSAGNDTENETLWLRYYRRSDHAVVKEDAIRGSEVVSTWIPDRPSPKFEFPLYAGKTWMRTEKTRLDTPSPENHTVTFTCLRTTEVSTPAGTFDSYKLGMDVTAENTSRVQMDYLLYYAPEVGNMVKAVNQWEDNNTGGTTIIELLSYSYTVEPHDEDKIPALDAVFLLAAIAAMFVMMRTKKRRGRLN